MSTWREIQNKRGQTAGVTTNLLEGRPQTTQQHTPQHTTPQHNTTVTTTTHHTEHLYKFLLRDVINSPFNERTKVVHSGFPGQVRLLRTERGGGESWRKGKKSCEREERKKEWKAKSRERDRNENKLRLRRE